MVEEAPKLSRWNAWLYAKREFVAQVVQARGLRVVRWASPHHHVEVDLSLAAPLSDLVAFVRIEVVKPRGPDGSAFLQVELLTNRNGALWPSSGTAGGTVVGRFVGFIDALEHADEVLRAYDASRRLSLAVDAAERLTYA